MNLSKEEKLMYKVMKAVYDGGIPLSFKGSMVLKVCLLEGGYIEDTRHTVDIDGNWISDVLPSQDKMKESLQKALDNENIPLNIIVNREYGEGRSAGFDLYDKQTNEILFSMDIDVGRPTLFNKIYEIEGVRFLGVSPIQMIADKILVVSTKKVFRRIKDVVDLYYLSKIFTIDKNELLYFLKETGRTLGEFNEFLNEKDELKHSYEKFRFSGNINKPPFEEIYNDAKTYISELLPKERRG